MNKLIITTIILIFTLISCGNTEEIIKDKTITDLAKTENSIGFYLYTKEKSRKVVVIRNKTTIAKLPNSKESYNDDLVSKFTKLDYVEENDKNTENYVAYDNTENGFVHIKELKANTKYSIDIYVVDDKGVNLLETFDASTVAEKPKENADNLVFTHVTDSNIGIGWKNGNGERRLVLMSKDTTPIMPINGRGYFALPEFGNKANQIPGTNTYVIYNGSMKKDMFLDIKIPEPGKYFFYVAEYNGEGETANYNLTTTNTNPRFKVTKLIPPVANKVTEFLEETFMVSWSKVNDAVSYEVMVAYDKDFNNLVDTYEGANVGNTTVFEIYAEDKSKTYYYKVRAIGEESVSIYSEPIEVKFKK